MNFDKLRRQAQQIYTKRGGSAAAKADGQELKDIAGGRGSLADKAKAAAQALKDPGAPGEGAPRDPASPPPPSAGAR
ncbi:MAG: hypothetical protein ACR2K9_05230 [Solirubrobacteraceae bacterium]